METVALSSLNGTYFSSLVPDVTIALTGTAVKTRVRMTCNGTLFYEEALWPVAGTVTIMELGDLFAPYAQKHLAVTVGIESQPLNADDEEVGAPTSSTISVLFSRADVGVPASEFYTSHFLTILQGTKITARGRLEYLYYYGSEAARVKAEYDDGSIQWFDALQSGGSSVYTQLDVSPDYYAVAGRQLVAYTVTAGLRSQRFEMDLSEPDCAPIMEFYNSFGVWELLYCTGTHQVTPEYKRSSTRVNGRMRNYLIEESRNFKADTGFLNTAMANWADDLFRSDMVYVVNVVDGQLTSIGGGREVVITDSKSDNSNDDDHMPRFTFTYQYAQRNHNVLQMNRVGRIFDNTFDHTFS